MDDETKLRLERLQLVLNTGGPAYSPGDLEVVDAYSDRLVAALGLLGADDETVALVEALHGVLCGGYES